MKIKNLIELLSKLNPEAEIKIGGWKEQNNISRYTWDSESLQEKHIHFCRDKDEKLTVHLEFDI
jgi:hypothetical protein